MSDSNKFDAETLADLLAKVKASTQTEKSLDRAIMCSIGGWQRLSPSEHPRNHKHPMFVDLREGYSSFEGRELWRDVPQVTGSIDAALALTDRLLGGVMWRVQSDPDSGDGFSATIVAPYRDGSAEGATAPLAILAALLSALLSALPNTQGKA